MPRTQYWCFTLNNPTPAEILKIDELSTPERRVDEGVFFLVYGRELGEAGTPHLQGYIEFRARKRLSAAKKAVGERAHLEPRRGTFWEAYEYCVKDGDFEQYGRPVDDDDSRTERRGKRTDLERVRTLIVSGAEEKEIADAHFGSWVRYRKSFDAYAELCRTREERPHLKVILLHGTTGTGKTRLAMDFARWKELPLFAVPDPGLRWFDGYRGQEIVLLDDFAGNADFRFLLRLLDRYPLDVAVKGGFVYWEPSYIFITTNVEPEDWFPNEDIAPLRRRIHVVRNVTGGLSPFRELEELCDQLAQERIPE